MPQDIKIVNKVHAQSPDIARATTDLKNKTGWNDMGVFYGSFDSKTPTGQGVGKYLAQSFGDFLFKESLYNNTLGSDIKISFTLDIDDKDLYTPKEITHITVAIPTVQSQEDILVLVKTFYSQWVNKIKIDLSKETKDYSLIVDLISKSEPEFTVNGTGKYTSFGFHSDASMTGRKLAVNNMSAGPVYSQCQCGGGSYIKPWHASDFLLPMVCTWIAKAIVDLKLSPYANVALACTIGSTKVDSLCITGDVKFNKDVRLRKALVDCILKQDITPDGLKNQWNLLKDSFSFYKADLQNFITDVKDPDNNNTPWYNTDYLEDIIEKEVLKN